MGNKLSYFYNNVDTEYNKYGWVPDKDDSRDFIRKYTYNKKNPRVDLRDKCPEIYNQETLGSCTANAIAAAYQYDEIKQNTSNVFVPSRLFIYYNERDMEGTVNNDSGAQIRDGIKSVNSIGVCPETLWPYDIGKFTEKPNAKCYDIAKNNTSIKYERIKHDFDHMQDCLAAGYPFVFGFAVYESFESEKVANTGIMPMPSRKEKMLGGHAVMAVGYDDDRGVFIIRNSWGSNWGDNGYFYMPYEFIIADKYCSDFWTIKKIRDE